MSLLPNVGEEEMTLFLEELEEKVQTLEDGFLSLEKGGSDQETLNQCFRAAHTVKGSSAAVGHQQMTALTHAMENILDRMRKGELSSSREAMDALFLSLDALRALKKQLIEGDGTAVDLNDVLQNLRVVAEAETRDEAAGAQLPASLSENARLRFRSAREEGLVGLKVEVKLSPESVMPSVRAYQLYLALGEHGDLVASFPSLEEIQAEKVGTDVTFFLVTAEARETIRHAATSVTDVVGVEIARVEAEAEAEGEQQGNEGKDQNVPVPGQAALETRTVRVDVAVLDNLMNLIGELVIDRTCLGQLSTRLATARGVEELAGEVGRVSNHLGRITGFLQDEILKARMLPLERLFKRFPRMIRDLSRKFGKEFEFVIRGEDTELDRAVMEMLGDPLIHLLRNAIDHGIETAEERVRVGKDPRGRISLTAYHSYNQIIVEVADDGRGIDPGILREVAVNKGVISPERARELSDRDALMLIFAPGFSTAKEVSEVSGRGVGMDIVRKSIDRVGGRVEVSSEVGRGTTMRIYLPLTLATIRALLVQVAGQIFALPLSVVSETMRISREHISTMRKQEVVMVRDKVVPIKRLDGYVAPEMAHTQAQDFCYAVLVNADGSTVGLVVDSLIGEQEIVIKNLGRFIGDVRGLAGSTILGDGSVALILEVSGLQRGAWEGERAVGAAV